MAELKYTKNHEWIKIEGDAAIIGITEHAANALGELVYVELPENDSSYVKGDAFAVVESSKSASDVYMPVTGEVVEVNEALNDNPEKVNESSYDDGWIAKIKVANVGELDELLDENAYNEILKEEA